MTHHSVPNCAKMQNRQRTSAHFFHTSSSHSAPFLQKQYGAAASLCSRFDSSAAFGTGQFGKGACMGLGRSVDAFNRFIFYKSACVCFVCRGKAWLCLRYVSLTLQNFFALI